MKYIVQGCRMPTCIQKNVQIKRVETNLKIQMKQLLLTKGKNSSKIVTEFEYLNWGDQRNKNSSVILEHMYASIYTYTYLPKYVFTYVHT